jgi:NTE family protein
MKPHKPQPEPVAAPMVDRKKVGQVVLVFQGGGALGAYQAGVYQALQEAGIEPDWVIGTSIGAINGALIAGNAPEHRLERLRAFWAQTRHTQLTQLIGSNPFGGRDLANAMTMLAGVPGFFAPKPFGWLGQMAPFLPGLDSYYSTDALLATLERLIDGDLLNAGAPRLTVGTAHVQTGEMRYFDSREERLDLRHVMASGALPPAFPAVRIDGELYWDGGILSNTPVEAVFDDNPRRDGLVFVVNMWAPNGPEPNSLNKVAARQKDLQYSSRATSHMLRQRQIHKLRHVIATMAAMLPPEERNSPEARELAAYGCMTQMHVVRLLAPPLEGDDHFKDIDSSPAGITGRWNAGYEDTKHVLDERPWTRPCDPLEGFLLHEARAGQMVQDAPPLKQAAE